MSVLRCQRGVQRILEIVLESAASVDVTLTLVLENELGEVTARDYSLTPTAVFISAGMTSADGIVYGIG